MNPSVLARFATACGAFAPLEIAIEYSDGTVAATGVLQQPFALVGRDPACDIALTTPDAEPQTAVLQVLGGQVFVADLGTKGGLRWRHGRHPFGWMPAGEPLGIGPFTLRLLAPVSPHPTVFGPTFHPLAAGPDVPAGLPPVEVQFKTGTADRTRWPVNRVLTLIGSAPDCKIHLGGDDVAAHHCYLVHTPDGLWAVDVSGPARGIRVNGQRTRLARLGEADELAVGRFVIHVSYPRPSADDGLVSFDEVPRPARPTESDSPTESARRPGDLSSMAGFGVPAARLPLVKTEPDLALPPEPAADWHSQEETDPIHRPATPTRLTEHDADDVIVGDSAPPAADAVLPTLQTLAGLHARMLADFQDTLARLPAAFAALPPERRTAATAILARLTDATAELAGRQAELLLNLDAAPRDLDRVTHLHTARESLVRQLADAVGG